MEQMNLWLINQLKRAAAGVVIKNPTGFPRHVDSQQGIAC
jgi:hypothetical protein